MPEWLKIAEYAKKHNITIGKAKELINAGILKAQQESKGCHVWVFDVPADVVPKSEYDKLSKEIAVLKSRLDSILKLATNE